MMVPHPVPLEVNVRITTLVENDVLDGHEGLIPEFGLSLHVEFGGTRIVFDTGASDTFSSNAATLGIDISDVDAAVLSHHHFDHGGGLARFLELNQRAEIFLRGGEIADRFFKALVVLKRPIGIDLELLERSSDRFTFVSGPTEIAPGVFLLTDIGSAHARPAGNSKLFVNRDGRLVPDPFDHELLMVIRDDDGLVVFSGCSHHGILNMIDAAVDQFPGEPVKAVLGGFHLIGLPIFNSMAAPKDEVEEIGRKILARSPGKVYTGHCTGEKAFRVLAGVMGDTLEPFHTGSVIEV
jgi:7,8-dihydropterin-6-yl-methyl-4-(beta-D-ribofuranosyl)aminobenzene 5'-phosphate synthase